MIGFPKTIKDFSNNKPPMAAKAWKSYFENQTQFYLDDKEFFSKQTEAWKYFPVGKLFKQDFVFDLSNSSENFKKASPYLSSSLTLSVHNGSLQDSFLDSKELFICSWKDFLLSKKNLDPKIKNKILSTLKIKRNPFCSLNNAMGSDGWIIVVKKTLKKPLEIHYTQSNSSEEQGLNLRNFIFVEEEAEAQILEVFHGQSENKPVFLNIQTDGFLEKKAQMEHSRVDQSSKEDTIIHQFFGELSHSAKAQFFTLSLNARLGGFVTDLTHGEKSSSQIHGLSLLEGYQQADHKVSARHEGKQGSSHQLYKSFLFDSARQIFQGGIFIDQEAQKAETSQLSKNFLFGKKAFAVAIPELDVVADDVQAGHGAVVAPFTEKQDLVFYLQSRGIDFLEASHLILFSLMEETLSCLQDNSQKFIKSLIEKKFQSLKARDLKEAF